MHRSVFTKIVTLSAYFLSLRLSGVLEVDTSVGRRCSTIVGGDLSVAFMCLGCGDGEQTYPGLWFLPVWHGGIPDSLLLLFVLFVPVGATARCCFPFAFVGLSVGGFLVFLVFVPLSFRIYFLELLKSAWSWRCEG